MSQGGLLAGKRVLVTGVLNHESIAFAVARIAQEQGAQVLLTSFGRVRSITERAARRLPDPPDIVELDVSDESHFDELAKKSTAGGAESTAWWMRSLMPPPTASTEAS